MHKCSNYVAMSMMASQTLKSVDFTKTQKFRYLENETLIFLKMKELINYTSRATLLKKKSFVLEVILKNRNIDEKEWTRLVFRKTWKRESKGLDCM